MNRVMRTLVLGGMLACLAARAEGQTTPPLVPPPPAPVGASEMPPPAPVHGPGSPAPAPAAQPLFPPEPAHAAAPGAPAAPAGRPRLLRRLRGGQDGEPRGRLLGRLRSRLQGGR